jgi:hypothetical protein
MALVVGLNILKAAAIGIALLENGYASSAG